MNFLNFLNPYLKFIVSLLGTGEVAIVTFEPSASWSATAIAAITSLIVYFTANIPKSVAPVVQDTRSPMQNR